MRTAVLDEFNGTGTRAELRVGMAQDVYASRFYSSVIAAGVQNLLSIQLAAPVSDGTGDWQEVISVGADEFPVLDKNDIIITIVED